MHGKSLRNNTKLNRYTFRIGYFNNIKNGGKSTIEGLMITLTTQESDKYINLGNKKTNVSFCIQYINGNYND